MQVNKIETQKKLKMLEIQAEMLKTSKKKYELTDKEISNLTPDTRFVCRSSFVFFYYEKPKLNLFNINSILQYLFISWPNVCPINIT